MSHKHKESPVLGCVLVALTVLFCIVFYAVQAIEVANHRRAVHAFIDDMVHIKDVHSMPPDSETFVNQPARIVVRASDFDIVTVRADDAFGVQTFAPALSLRRITEYCQWQQVSVTTPSSGEDDSDETTYIYFLQWMSHPMPSLFSPNHCCTTIRCAPRIRISSTRATT